jgi:hypothetical protein
MICPVGILSLHAFQSGWCTAGFQAMHPACRERPLHPQVKPHYQVLQLAVDLKQKLELRQVRLSGKCNNPVGAGGVKALRHLILPVSKIYIL